jgi:predicted esterase
VNNAIDTALCATTTPLTPAGLGAIDRVTASLRAGTDFLPQHLIALSLQVRVEPPVWRADLPPPAISASRLYVVRFNREGYEAPRILVSVKAPDGAVVAQREFVVDEDSPWPQSMPLFDGPPPADLAPGVYTLAARWAEGRPREFDVGRWQVASRSYDALRIENAARIEAAGAAHPALAPIGALVAGRNTLLTDTPSPDQSGQWNADLARLAHDLHREIADLEAGRNPFAGRDGDWWLRAPLAGVEAPVRVFVPPGPGGQPAPVLLVLHGVGVDENAALDACGAGALRRLATAHACIVVSPGTSAMAYPASFDGLVDMLGAWRPIDRSRVYLLGHSSGGTLAASIVRARPDDVAALVLVASAPSLTIPPGTRAPRTLFVSGRDDGLTHPSRVRAAASAAREHGMVVETIDIPTAGHALALRQSIDRVVDWLFAQD